MKISLETLNSPAYHYQLSVQDRIVMICKPLFNLGIKYFFYGRIFKDGRYLMLLNHQEYQKNFYFMIKNNGLTFTKNLEGFSVGKPSYFLLSQNLMYFDKNKDPIMHLLHEFNIWNIFYIYKEKCPHSMECYGFAGEKNDVLLTNFYINNIPFLEEFCCYFEKAASDLIDCKDKTKLAYFEQEFKLYNASQEKWLTQEIEAFLQETFRNKQVLKTKTQDIRLSKREVECLRYLCLGKSAKKNWKKP